MNDAVFNSPKNHTTELRYISYGMRSERLTLLDQLLEESMI